MKIKLPYGKTFQETEIDDSRIQGILTSHLEEYHPEDDQLTIVKEAMANPIESKIKRACCR